MAVLGQKSLIHVITNTLLYYFWNIPDSEWWTWCFGTEDSGLPGIWEVKQAGIPSPDGIAAWEMSAQDSPWVEGRALRATILVSAVVISKVSLQPNGTDSGRYPWCAMWDRHISPKHLRDLRPCCIVNGRRMQEEVAGRGVARNGDHWCVLWIKKSHLKGVRW